MVKVKSSSCVLPARIVSRMLGDRAVRIAIVRKSHFLFFNFYLAHHVTYPTAEFHREIFRLTEQTNIRNLCIMAFRGSGKSTILTLSYPLWAILGVQQKKYVVIFCQTRAQAKQAIANLVVELKTNSLLKNDLGPFKEESDEWELFSIVFSNLGARIMAVSVEYNVRGMRHGQYRPDLVICDDVESPASVETIGEEHKTYKWLKREVIPAGSENMRLVVVGNLLHAKSLLIRLRSDVRDKRMEGVFRAYPLVDDNGKMLWPGKFPTAESIEEFKRSISDEDVWKEEYLLQTSRGAGDAVIFYGPADENKERLPYDPRESPPRYFGDYKISAPILLPENVHYVSIEKMFGELSEEYVEKIVKRIEEVKEKAKER